MKNLSIFLASLLLGVVLPWPQNHPWSQAILYRRRPDIRRISCEPLRCMDGSRYATCDYYGRPVAYVQSPCRGH